MNSSAKTRRITNELFKFEHEKVSQKLNCYLVNHDESDMRFNTTKVKMMITIN